MTLAEQKSIIANADLHGSSTSSPLVHDLFVAQALLTPTRPALIGVSRTITYGALLGLARGWGDRVRSLGAAPNTLVAVVMEKGWEQIVSVLGILQSGAAYLPIDAACPNERLRFLLENSEAKIVLTQSSIDQKFDWPESVTRLLVDLENPTFDGPIVHERPQSADDLAYVLYTSGSTGKPKGVMVAHEGLVNCILETNRTFAVTAEDRVLAVTALHHDMSVYDLFGPLAVGGTIIIPDPKTARSPDHWLDLISKHHVTLWNSVPAFMEMLLVHCAAQDVRLHGHLRLAFLGGDWIPLSAPRRIREHFGDVQVVSVGGPTETTVWNIWYPVEEVNPEWKSIPYGHPIANTRYYVMDEQLRECPPAVAGELCCAGVGLLKGYWRNEEQTRARTAIHSQTGERIYRTGDRGRLMPDGEIEFLGRIDRQIKINGQRIELGEIEATLLRQPSVKQAIVEPTEIAGLKRLTAYVVPEANHQLDGNSLRTALEKFLPAYMIPSSFLVLESLPLNANGKVDRTLLPAPATENVDVVPVKAGTEEIVLKVWKKVLGLAHVTPTDNFFDLGGDSILIVEAHAELQQALNRKFSLTDLFQFPSIRTLSNYLDGQKLDMASSDISDRIRKQRDAMARQRNKVGQLS